MTREERRKYMKKWREEHKEYMKKWNAENREERKEYQRKYYAKDLNKNGVTKRHIRIMSFRILEKCHAKLPGYQIHHCFGYEDPSRFIYIPRELHIKIHKYLRDNKISADTDHWKNIAEIVNECENYTYIRT